MHCKRAPPSKDDASFLDYFAGRAQTARSERHNAVAGDNKFNAKIEMHEIWK